MTLGFLGDLLGLNSGDAAINAANKNRTALTNAQTQGNNIINQGYGQANDYLSGLASQYQPLATGAENAGAMYANALGLNGPSGNAAATAAYQTSPGYQFQIDQGLQALDRGAAAHGQLQSGQSGLDYLKYSQGLANQDYGNWLSALGNSNSSILGTGLSGLANTTGALASNATGQSGAQLGLLGDITSGQMGANNQQAAGEQANTQGLSNLFGNIVGGIGSIATGGLSNLMNVGNVFGNKSQGAQGNAFTFGYGGF